MDHPSIATALVAANIVLGLSSNVVFTQGWIRKPLKPAIRVFATTGEGRGQNEIMSSYKECKCVVVQAGALTNWIKDHEGESTALLDLDAQNLLSYMLLHEAGHLVRNELLSLRAEASKGTQAAPANDGETSQSREIAADEFATEAVRSALMESGRERGLAAAKLSLTLSKLSWNLSAHRLIDDFGGTMLNKPSLFQDSGFSHPNLEWRILSVNALISPSVPARQLLSDFENRRKSGPVYHLR